MASALVGVLDSVRSRYNVGAIFRTADGLGVSRLYLCGITPRPDREEDRVGIAKTALGAEQTVPWEGVGETGELVDRLKREGYFVLALETDVHGLPLAELTSDPRLLSSARIALVVGHELYGIHADVLQLADQIVEIPMHGTKRSLNVEVAFAIATYALQRELAPRSSESEVGSRLPSRSPRTRSYTRRV